MSTQRVTGIFVFLVERSNGLNPFYSYNPLFYFTVAHSFYISNYCSLRGLSNCSFLLFFSHLGFSSVKPGNPLIQHFILSFLKWELSSIYTFHLSLRLYAHVISQEKNASQQTQIKTKHLSHYLAYFQLKKFFYYGSPF